jgi:hypothetical protein
MPVRGVTTNVGRDVSADFCAAPIDVSSSIAVATSKVIDGICLVAMVWKMAFGHTATAIP